MVDNNTSEIISPRPKRRGEIMSSQIAYRIQRKIDEPALINIPEGRNTNREFRLIS